MFVLLLVITLHGVMQQGTYAPNGVTIRYSGYEECAAVAKTERQRIAHKLPKGSEFTLACVPEETLRK